MVASIEALASIYTPKELYESHSFKFTIGDVIDFKKLGEKLIESGYERMDMVDGKGQFSIRGGIMDIYPPDASLPFRVELFDEEIDSIRTFNVDTQRSIDKVKSIEIFPAKEIILNEETIKSAYNSMGKELEEFISSPKNSKDKEVIKKSYSRCKSKYGES